MIDQAKRAGIIQRTSLIGIGGNIFLSVLKAAVALGAGSTAIMMDAVNNLSDAVSSLVTLVGTRLALRPADRDHPMGHGRIEYLTALIVSALVMAAGISALVEAVGKIFVPRLARYTAESVLLIALGVAVKLALGLYTRKMGRRAASPALSASGTDAFFDALVSLVTLISMQITRHWGLYLEGYLGTLIALMIIRSGFTILWGTLQDILGRRTDAALAADIRAEVLSFPEVLGVYDLYLDAYGPGHLAGALHIEVRDDMTAREITRLCRAITDSIRNQFGAMMTCGIYGIDMEDEEVIALRQGVKEIVLQHPGVLQLHGFSLDKETKTITFDIVRDFAVKDTARLLEEVTRKLEEHYPLYRFVITPDPDLAD